MGTPRLLLVHAHPDDESSKGAATMAKYAANGARVMVVTLTGGERGDILNPAMDLPEVHGRIHEVRRDEMARAAEILGVEADMHKYAVQITVADVRDGACSSSPLHEAASWGKVQTTHEQMVFAEATTVVPLIGSDAYHRGAWKARDKRRWNKLFEKG